MIKVERDKTILKDTKSFVSRLIQERGLFEGDVMHRVSIDGGDRSVKVILNTFDRNYDPEISFPKLETKGNLLSGVNQSIIMAYCEDLEENYENIRTIF